MEIMGLKYTRYTGIPCLFFEDNKPSMTSWNIAAFYVVREGIANIDALSWSHKGSYWGMLTHEYDKELIGDAQIEKTMKSYFNIYLWK